MFLYNKGYLEIQINKLKGNQDNKIWSNENHKAIRLWMKRIDSKQTAVEYCNKYLRFRNPLGGFSCLLDEFSVNWSWVYKSCVILCMTRIQRALHLFPAAIGDYFCTLELSSKAQEKCMSLKIWQIDHFFCGKKWREVLRDFLRK